MVEKAGDQELGASPACLGLTTTVAQKQRKRVKVGGGFFVNVLLTHSRRLTAVGFAVQRHFKVSDAITTNYRRSILIGNLSLQRVRIDYEFGHFLSVSFYYMSVFLQVNVKNYENSKENILGKRVEVCVAFTHFT